MIGAPSPDASEAPARAGRGWRRLTLACVIAGVLLRLSFLTWQDPWGPHHPDEGILPLEALALWEGITPREVGWPASTMRLALSVAAANAFAVQAGRAAWQARERPERALETVTTWIGRQYLHRTLLVEIGRFLAFAIGTLQLLATVWTLRRWLPEPGVFAGTVVVALNVLAIAYSHYVLADISGVLFATLIVGLAAAPTAGSIRAMAVLAGFAAASKFHFGLWILAPVLCIWSTAGSPASKLRATLVALGLSAAVVIALVPWLWLNPTLQMKEFAGVVLAKIGTGAPPAARLGSLLVITGALGVAGWIGGLAGAASMGRADVRRWAPVLAPTLAGLLAIASSQIVADRYALVLLPGVALLAGAGWQRLLAARGTIARRVAVGALAAAIVWSLADDLAAERTRREVDVDVLAARWVLAHVPRGSRIALHDEAVARPPRSAATLQRCLARIDAPDAYEDKWAVEGIVIPDTAAEPMRSAVLSDERFFAYWCRRELDVRTDPGYDVVLYHAGPRFWAVAEQEALDEFHDGRLDVLDPEHGPLRRAAAIRGAHDAARHPSDLYAGGGR